MKQPNSPFHFVQVCVVLSILSLMAVSVFVAKQPGGIPPWLIVVLGGEPPAPPATVPLIKVLDYKGARVSGDATMIDRHFTLDGLVVSFPETVAYSPKKSTPLSTIPISSRIGALQAAPQQPRNTWLAMFAILALIGASFGQSLLPSGRKPPLNVKPADN